MRKEEAKTKARALVLLEAFLLSIFLVAAVAAQVSPPPPMSGELIEEPQTEYNYAKLQISPGYGHLQMEPGDEKEFTVKVKNKEEVAVLVNPRVVIPPYGEYQLEEEWVEISPSDIEIKAGGEQKFTVKVKIPKDVDRGYYSAQIVFTNDTIPMPYPEPFPSYVNALHLSVDVWTPPKILIQPQYIQDRVEAGQSREYKIQLENKGNEAIAINPEIGGERYYYDPYGPSMLPEDWLTIDAPAKVEANSKATVKITVNVPADAKVMYDGSVSLNIDDPSIEEWNQMVQIHIEVWKQPTTPFKEDFTVKQGEKFTVEITARQYAYDKYGGAEEKEKPSFIVAVATPEGSKLTPEPSKTVKKGEISLGMGYLPPWEASSEGMYHVMSTVYSERYTLTNVTGGLWTLEILPRNAESFEYTIEIGE
ncbi:MAG: hypothetical protein QMD80_04705 [archaeon]|nr:hypothetical protein [archaeon]